MSDTGLLSELWQGFLDFVYPPRCEVCETLGKEAFCERCRSLLQPLEPPLCHVCGALLQPSAAAQGMCPECRHTRRYFNAARSCGLHVQTLRRAILNFKFGNRRRLQQPLGALLYERIVAEPDLPLRDCDCLVPVPLHPSRRQWRGFDQAAYLCQEVSRHLGKPMLEGALVRTRPTTPQVELTPLQRQENVRGAFAPQGEELRGQTVLLIDDVFTTGATVNQAARAARAGGAVAVYVLTISRPPPPWHPAALALEPGDA